MLDEPRRKYELPRAEVLAALPPGIEATCPTEDERKACEAATTVLGMTFPGKVITTRCTGAASDCKMADGKCVNPLASSGLPPSLRGYEDTLWQRNPFKLERPGQPLARDQASGVDVSELYWIARAQGQLETGKNLILAWQPTGSCTP